MKKQLISVLLIIAVFAGCTSKSGNGTADTANKASASTGGPAVPTTKIMPPQNASQPILLSTQEGMPSHPVNYSINFTGINSQTVTIKPGGGRFSGPGTFTFVQTPPPNGGFDTVAASVTPGFYNHVVNSPNLIVNNTGFDTTTYSDSLGNSVVIMIADTGQ